MDKKKSGSGWAAFLSGLCVLGAVALLLTVCGYCYPSVRTELQEVLAGLEHGAVRQAFGTLAEGLESGEPIRETLSETVQVLLHEKS